MKDNPSSVIVIGYCWPSVDNGYGLAVRSALEQYSRIYGVVYFIGLTDSEPVSLEGDLQNVQFAHVFTYRRPKSVRFFLSLASSMPAISNQFESKTILDQLLNIVARITRWHEKVQVIFEDLPVAFSFLRVMRSKFPNVAIAIHSHNVLSNVFTPLTREGSIPSRAAWQIEVSKIRHKEKTICQQADRVWAISSDDQHEYLVQLGIVCHGVFGVSLNSDHYATIAPGDSQTVVFIGGVDLRKRLGIISFIKHGWPMVRSRVPNARFVLAGIGSETINDPTNGIYGLGYVTDDREVWAEGQIALNPQELGSGIKLKSIIAMLAGRAVVSTYTGVEGIEGENGKHFFSGPDAQSLAPFIIQLMKNPVQAKEMGQTAKEWARDMYSTDRLTRSVSPLLEDFMRINVVCTREQANQGMN